jgi:hypothetical protein
MTPRSSDIMPTTRKMRETVEDAMEFNVRSWTLVVKIDSERLDSEAQVISIRDQLENGNRV